MFTSYILTSLIDIQDSNSILQFGQKPSEEISKISDELLQTVRSVNSDEASQMLVQLTKIMDRFDIKELENVNQSSGNLHGREATHRVRSPSSQTAIIHQSCH